MIDTLLDRRVVSIVGNAKNAGKTTVLNHLISAESGRLIAVTSIGLDGEELDQITRLPKPRIHVAKGTYVATAAECLKQSSARFRVLEITDLTTPLGAVHIVEAIEDGTMLVAGPSTKTEMERLTSRLIELGATRVYVDGAFSRRQFARVGDALILVFGANLSYDMNAVVKHAALWTKLYSLPQTQSSWRGETLPDTAAWLCESGIQRLPERRSIEFQETTFAAIPSDALGLWLPGAWTDQAARLWLKQPASKRLFVWLSNASNVLLSTPVLERFFRIAPSVSVLEPMNVAAVCVNPFRPTGPSFESEPFLQAVKDAVGLPVFDVLAKGDST